ncbi:MAG: O-antigen ligase family protein [Bacteroidetes bacterium]|nr:O-antigen ligase family protein [Bacteroidota bacterium]
MEVLTKINSDEYSINTPINYIWIVIAFLLFEAVALVSSVINPLYAIGIFVASLLILYSIRNIFVGICILVFLHLLALRGTEQIDPGEIFFGIFLFLLLITWFYDKKIVRGERLLEDTMDYSLAIFFGICLFSLAPALIFGNSLLKWFRELVPFLGYLLYYPVKDTVNTLKRIKILGLCFLILVVISGLVNIIQYQQLLGQVSYFWEIEASRQTPNEPFFLVSLIVSSAFFLYTKGLRRRLLSLGIVLFSGFALVVSFSRGYWVAAMVALVFVFVFVDLGKKLKVLVYIPLIILPAVIIANMYLGNLKELFYHVVFERFTTLVDLQQDISLVNRFNEAKTLLTLCVVNPIIGYGLGAMYSFHNILFGYTLRTWYTHNAFIFLLFKLGILGLLSFLIFYFNAIRKGFFNFKKLKNDWYQKSLSIGITCCLISMIPLSFTSPQFIQKNSILVITLGSALIGVIHKKLRVRGFDGD